MTSDALALLFSLLLEPELRWGAVAFEFQIHDATAILDLSSRTPYFFLTRARGASKTLDLAAIVLVVMLTQAPRGARLYILAADRDQGALFIDSIRRFAEFSPAIASLIQILNYKVSVPSTGVTLTVLAADAPGAYGLRPYFLVVDEIALWAQTSQSHQLLDAILTAITKVKGARLVVLTTAGSPSHFSHDLLLHAYSDPLWYVNEVRGPAPWTDLERLAEQERGRTPATFRRPYLNEWTEDDDRLANREDLEACVTHAGVLPPQPGVHYAIGLDVGVVNDRTAVAVCHAEPSSDADGGTEHPPFRIVLDRLDVWRGSREEPVELQAVSDQLLETAKIYRSATVVFDPHESQQISQQLRSRRIWVEQFNFNTSSNGQLATTLYQLIRNRLLALPGDKELLAELSRVRIRETTPGVPRLDHDPGQHDDRAIALALAADWLLKHPPGSGPRVRGLVGR
jgi:phage terminase large subunit-like protein